ncbi:MAG: diguanylate cyclase [Candidatus Sericytochromatia bacterium]|nr:diguanylate cyclase [Candidatus Tanganyikabacteria bacterium]
MPLSEALTRRVLEPIAKLWREAEDLAEFARGAAAIWGEGLGKTDCAIAFREDGSRPWRPFAGSPEVEAHFAGLLLSYGDRDLAPLADEDGRMWLPVALPVPRPLGGIFFAPEVVAGEWETAAHMVAAGLAASAFGRKAIRADLMMGEVARKLHALQLLTLNINNAYDLNQLSQNICTIVAQATGAQYACLYHREPGGLRLVEDLAVYPPKQGSLRDILRKGGIQEVAPTVPLSEAGFLADVLEEGKPMVIPNLAALGEPPAGLGKHGLLAAMAVPLLTQREELGVLLVGSRQPRLFTSAELETLADLAQAATGALLTSRLYFEAHQERNRVAALVDKLRDLTKATREVGKTLDMHVACKELVSHLPHFMQPVHWVDVYLAGIEGWTFAAGSSTQGFKPADQWLYFLDKTGYPPSLDLPREALEGTPFSEAGKVVLFPLKVQQACLGLVVVATESETETTGRDMVETLVAHTASAVFNAIQWQREHERSITDGLTGVFNRRYFNQRLHEEQQKGYRYNRPFSLIILDIDHFKICNDYLGHLAGDTVLKQTAAFLRDQTRKVDIVARFGGEEFAVILPETGYEGAWQVAEKLRLGVAEFPFADQELLPDRTITASFGFSTYPVHGPSTEALIHVADEALYHAKQNGRNQVGVPPREQLE